MARKVNMQRRHFELIAETIRNLQHEGLGENMMAMIAEKFADALKPTNENFNTCRFLEAALKPVN